MENPFQKNSNQRPTFLMVLCILTFIGSGWGVLSNLFSLFTSGAADANAQMQQAASVMENLESESSSSFLTGMFQSSMEILQVTLEHAKEMAAIGLVLSIISVLGAIMMFRLRRTGFYLYTGAQVLQLFVLPFFAGFSLLIFTSILFPLLITITFIILYAVNLKYMQPTALAE